MDPHGAVKPDDEEETDLAKAPSRIPDPEVNEGAGRDLGGAELGRRHTGRDDVSRQEGWDEEPEGQAKAIAGGPAEVAALEDCPERQKGMDDERAVEEHAADRLRQAARNPVGDPHPRPRRTRARARDPGSVGHVREADEARAEPQAADPDRRDGERHSGRTARGGTGSAARLPFRVELRTVGDDRQLLAELAAGLPRRLPAPPGRLESRAGRG